MTDPLDREDAALDALEHASARLRRALDLNTPSPIYDEELEARRRELSAAISLWVSLRDSRRRT